MFFRTFRVSRLILHMMRADENGKTFDGRPKPLTDEQRKKAVYVGISYISAALILLILTVISRGIKILSVPSMIGVVLLIVGAIRWFLTAYSER